MVGDEALLAQRAVLGSDEHTPVLLELIEHQQVVTSAGAQQECRLHATIPQHLSQIEQRSHAHAAPHQQHLVQGGFPALQRKAVAQRQQAVQPVAFFQAGQAPRALAHRGYQQPQLVQLAIHEVDGDRTAQERRRTPVDTHLHKLSRSHLRQRPNVRQLQQHIALMHLHHLFHCQIKYIFLHNHSPFILVMIFKFR